MKKSTNGRQHHHEALGERATVTSPAGPSMKPKMELPGSPITKNGRRRRVETQSIVATASPATESLKPRRPLPGSPLNRNGRQRIVATQQERATALPAIVQMKPKAVLPGAPIKRNARQPAREAQKPLASATAPAIPPLKPNEGVPGSTSFIIETIKAHHRARRFAMGIQNVLDNKLASFVRINATDWHPTDDESERAKANKEVDTIIKAARTGEGDPLIIGMVAVTDKARAPADAERKKHEVKMERLAEELPAAAWVKSVHGFGLRGLATIIAETGDLSGYSNVSKVWKRLGYAPYKGKAGSTWKRPKWRNADALTAEEWTDNPFSGRRYALIHTCSLWLKNAQWIGMKQTEDGVGKPNGRFGEIYAERRAKTSITHPEWTKAHSHMDGLRVMMKQVLKELYLEWNPEKKDDTGRPVAREAQAKTATSQSPMAVAMMKPREPLPSGSPLR